MKKNFRLALFILLSFVLFLGLSACSKKSETENKEPEVKNQEVNVQKNMPKERNVTVSGPKISDLKVGDKIGDYIIKEIKGILCQSNCKTDPDLSGSISFEGEHVVTGKFYYSPEYPIKISFITNADSKMPELKDNFDKNIIELLISNPSISLMNKELIDDDFSIITKDLLGFADFTKKRTSDLKSSVFDQEVTIKIKNYSTELLAAGEAGPIAELVEIVKTVNNDSLDASGKKECKAWSSFSFEYPATWGDCASPLNKSVSFRTDYSKYKVDLVLFLNDSSKEEYERLRNVGFGFEKLNNLSGEFYEIPQGGSLMAGGLNVGEKYYKFVYNIQSNQPHPSDADFWMADHNVSLADRVSILKSISK